jgi:hypothetical protein
MAGADGANAGAAEKDQGHAAEKEINKVGSGIGKGKRKLKMELENWEKFSKQ